MPPGRPDETLDPTPLLTTTDHQIPRNQHRFLRRAPSLRGAARFLRRASSRRLLREPSMRVRESAAQQIEDQQSDWAYSKPIVILDLIWNLAFVMVSVIVMVMSRNEAPESPLRLWILGYCVQCVVHMVCVCVEFKRRSRANNANDDDVVDYDDETSSAKHLESANTMFSFIWWIIGFYWVSTGGQNLTRDSPQLYWLCITFLAFDVFFVVICVAVACVIGIAVCCCLPCIIAILYAVADQEGATKDDIDRLPKYKFRRIGDFDKQNGEIQISFGGVMTECNSDTPTETVLPPEAAECCICLCAYEDGTELRELPCRHHFHCTCIDKWLYINSTCPLCKFNILKTGNQSSSEDV